MTTTNNNDNLRIGDRVILDGKVPATVTNTGVWCGPVRNCYSANNQDGVSVKPDTGYENAGYTTRARAVAMSRVRPMAPRDSD